MQSELSQEASISLEDLQRIDRQSSKYTLDQKQQSIDLHPNQFAAYICHEQNRIIKKCLLEALDTKLMPGIPMRRVSCINCRDLNLNCENCKYCKSANKTCCKSLDCIYDYRVWKEDPTNQIYKSCKCKSSKAQYSSATFDIDWRLMSIISKINKKINVSYQLYFGAGMLWVAQQLPVQNNQKAQNKRLINIYYEDNFGLFYFYEKQIKQSNPTNLSQNNIRNFMNLLKINVKKYLQAKDAWQVSNLEEECQEIADFFFSHKTLQKIKTNLQNQNDNTYSNMPSIKYQGKFSQSLVSSKVKNNNNYEGCSEQVNEQIIFYYCPKTKLIFIRNAKFYQEDTQFSNIRGIQVKFVEGYDKPEKVAWFKDRKGDIFAIYQKALSIFRFNIHQKRYKQFILDTSIVFQRVESGSSLIYIQQKDIVFYFHPKQLKQSFYFSLYRPKGSEDNNKNKKDDLSKNSCTSVYIHENFAEKQKNIKINGLCKVIYVMQDYKFKKGKDVRKELVPVIYLLVQKKNYLPMGISIYKIIHTEQNVIISQIPSSGPVSQGNDPQRDISLKLGALFTLRYEKVHKLFYFTLNDSKPTLLSAKVTQSDGKDNLNWTEQFLELNGCNQVKLQFQKKKVDNYLKIVNYMICSTETNENSKESKKYPNILINDLAGMASNNDFRLLGYNSTTGRIVQLYFTYAQGHPAWRIYDLS